MEFKIGDHLRYLGLNKADLVCGARCKVVGKPFEGPSGRLIAVVYKENFYEINVADLEEFKELSPIRVAAHTLNHFLNRNSSDPWCHIAIAVDILHVMVTRRVYSVQIPDKWMGLKVESQWVGPIRFCNG